MSPFIGIIYVVGFIMKHVTAFFDKMTPKKKVKIKKETTVEEILERIQKESIRNAKRANFWNKVGDKISFVFRWIVLPLLVIGLIYLLYQKITQTGWLPILFVVVLAVVVSLFVVGLGFLIDRFYGRVGGFFMTVLKVINPLNWKAVKILGEMIKTAYTKACPLITWDE
jgi:hypothetical protein